MTFVRKTMQIGALVGSGDILARRSRPRRRRPSAMLLMCGASGTLALCLSGSR